MSTLGGDMGTQRPRHIAPHIVLRDADTIEIDAQVGPISDFWKRDSDNNVLATRMTQAPLRWLLGPKRKLSFDFRGETWTAVVQSQRMTCIKPEKRKLYLDQTLDPTTATGDTSEMSLDDFAALVAALNAKLPEWLAEWTPTVSEEEIAQQLAFASIHEPEVAEQLEFSFGPPSPQHNIPTKLAKAPANFCELQGHANFTVGIETWTFIIGTREKTNINAKKKTVAVDTTPRQGYTKPAAMQRAPEVIAALNEQLPSMMPQLEEMSAEARRYDEIKEPRVGDTLEFCFGPPDSDGDAFTKLAQAPEGFCSKQGFATFNVGEESWTLKLSDSEKTNIHAKKKTIAIHVNHTPGFTKPLGIQRMPEVVAALNEQLPAVLDALKESAKFDDVVPPIESDRLVLAFAPFNSRQWKTKITAAPAALLEHKGAASFSVDDESWVVKVTKKVNTHLDFEKRVLFLDISDDARYGGTSDYDADKAARVVDALNAQMDKVLATLSTYAEEKAKFKAVSKLENGERLECFVRQKELLKVRFTMMPDWFLNSRETYAFEFEDDLWICKVGAFLEIDQDERKIVFPNDYLRYQSMLPLNRLQALIETINAQLPHWLVALEDERANAPKRRLAQLAENGPLIKRWKTNE